MGNQQSAPKGEPPAISKEKEKKVNRRVSIQGLLQGKAPAADPSASNESATAQPLEHFQRPALQQHLQANQSTELPSKLLAPVGRSDSRASSKGEKKDASLPPSEQQPIPEPVAAGPMDVPNVAKGKQEEFHEPETHFQRHYTPVSHSRPPRLPLPIADAPVPESPTLAPIQTGNEDVSIFEDDDALEPQAQRLRRRSSMLSSTTQDDEEVGEELQPYAVDTVNKAVPRLIEWNHSGEKVYVTGTFANWERKFRLHRSKSRDGLSAVIHLPPGTHHLKFIVDGEMKTTSELPTAVDFTNVLVNYIEVSIDDIPKQRRLSDRTGRSIPKSVHPPLCLPNEATESDGEGQGEEERERLEQAEEEIPLGDFRQMVPQALIDMELPEDDPKYQQAVNVIGDAQGPPILPMFLGRSILNGILPMKDDSSVLTLPNHTVLNHLATSSIKNGVLATSVTTRYKQKYLTTIMYKPTTDI